MKENTRALLPLMIVLIAAIGAQTAPEGEENRGVSPQAAIEAAAADSLVPARPESLPVKAVEEGGELMKRSRLAARSLAVTLRVGKRLLGVWLETLLSPPARKG